MKKKTILITGASSGIGLATAKFFHEQGWNVAATMRKPDSVDLVESEGLKKYALDVLSKEQIQSAVSQIIEDFGGLDVLVNNAGYGTAGPLEAASEAQIRHQFDVNFFGVVDMIRAVVPKFREQGSGLIINISSIGGLITLPFFSVYHGTKWAMEGLTESLRFELNPFGIQLKIVEPGGVNTDFSGRSLVMFDLSEHTEYAGDIERYVKNFAPDSGREENYSTPRQMAESIYTAATDGKEQLRYISGADAQAMYARRQEVGTEAFMTELRKMMLD